MTVRKTASDGTLVCAWFKDEEQKQANFEPIALKKWQSLAEKMGAG